MLDGRGVGVGCGLGRSGLAASRNVLFPCERRAVFSAAGSVFSGCADTFSSPAVGAAFFAAGWGDSAAGLSSAPAIWGCLSEADGTQPVASEKTTIDIQ